jgi:hypothetical protein
VEQQVYSWNVALMNQVQMYIKTQPLVLYKAHIIAISSKCFIWLKYCSFISLKNWQHIWGTEDEDKQKNKNTNTEQCVGHRGNNHKEHK